MEITKQKSPNLAISDRDRNHFRFLDRWQKNHFFLGKQKQRVHFWYGPKMLTWIAMEGCPGQNLKKTPKKKTKKRNEKKSRNTLTNKSRRSQFDIEIGPDKATVADGRRVPAEATADERQQKPKKTKQKRIASQWTDRMNKTTDKEWPSGCCPNEREIKEKHSPNFILFFFNDFEIFYWWVVTPRDYPPDGTKSVDGSKQN